MNLTKGGPACQSFYRGKRKKARDMFVPGPFDHDSYLFFFFFTAFFFAFLAAFFFVAFLAAFFLAFFLAFFAAFLAAFFLAFFAGFFLAGFFGAAGLGAIIGASMPISAASTPQQYTGSSYTSPVRVTSIFRPQTLHSYCTILSISIPVPLLWTSNRA